jgi:hypothetical protein
MMDDASLPTPAHGRSDHDRRRKGLVSGEKGAHGSALFKLCETRKLPFNVVLSRSMFLLTQIFG